MCDCVNILSPFSYEFVYESMMIINWVIAECPISSPVWQPFSFTGALPNEVLWVGDQLHISISACTSGWRECLSLGVGRRDG